MKVFWSRCGPAQGNFGDKLTPLLLDYLGVHCHWAPPDQAELVGIGSLVELVPDRFRGIIWTTGKIREDGATDFRHAAVLALRGRLTLARATANSPETVALGDGGLLCSLFHRPARKRYKLGIIPHYVDAADPVVRTVAATSNDITIVDLSADPLDVIRTVSQCEAILSSSLHGLVLADSLAIPNRWIELNHGPKVVLGHGFKYRDYYSAFGLDDIAPYALRPLDTLDSLLPLLHPYARPGIDSLKDKLLTTFKSLLPAPSSAHAQSRTLDITARESFFLQQLGSHPWPQITKCSAPVDPTSPPSHATDPLPLPAAMANLRQDRCRLRQFFLDCLRLITTLHARHIAHRRIRPENILLANGRPVLTSFGWALQTVPADSSPAAQDVRDLGKVFAQVNDNLYPDFTQAIGLMLEPDPNFCIADPGALAGLFLPDPSPSHDTGSQLAVRILLERFHAQQQRFASLQSCIARLNSKVWSLNAELLRRDLCRLIPPGQTIILVDDGQLLPEAAATASDGCRFLPFLERDEVYWGPPPDDATAIQELERLRQAGAAILAFAWPAFWWLDHYQEFRGYLQSRFQTLLQNDRALVFDLRSERQTQTYPAN